MLPRDKEPKRIIIEHLIRKLELKKQPEALTKEEFKRLLREIERRYPHEVARELDRRYNLSQIEYRQIINAHADLRRAVRRPGTEFLAKLLLLYMGEELSREKVELVKSKFGHRPEKISGMGLLRAAGSIEGKRSVRVKNREHIEALLEHYTERGTIKRLPKSFDELKRKRRL